MTTRRRVRAPGVSAPKAARRKKLGMAAVLTTASAPDLRNARRVIDMGF
jgi:hypothetical protein